MEKRGRDVYAVKKKKKEPFLIWKNDFVKNINYRTLTYKLNIMLLN